MRKRLALEILGHSLPSFRGIDGLEAFGELAQEPVRDVLDHPGAAEAREPPRDVEVGVGVDAGDAALVGERVDDLGRGAALLRSVPSRAPKRISFEALEIRCDCYPAPRVMPILPLDDPEPFAPKESRP